MQKNTHILSTNPTRASELWRVDAETPLQAVLDSPECLPLLRQTLSGVLSWQTRNETPVRRALTSSRVAPQWVAALLALGATVTVEGDAGPAESSLEALLQRKKGGTITALYIPPPGPGRAGEAKWGEAHVARTPADEPIVAAVAVVEMDNSLTGTSRAQPSAPEQGGVVRQARVALTGVWPEPVRLAQAAARLVGGPLDESGIWAVAKAIEKEVAPRGDFRGSEEYRRAMAGVLARRALEGCLRQEVGNEQR